MAGTDGVLVVLDGSAQDVATLDWAVEEADALGSGLAVARLRSDSPAPDRAPARLAADGRRSQAAVLDVAAGRAAEASGPDAGDDLGRLRRPAAGSCCGLRSSRAGWCSERAGPAGCTTRWPGRSPR